jgi:hypothetical protein
MTPDQWREIRPILQSALELVPADRIVLKRRAAVAAFMQVLRRRGFAPMA